LFKQLAHGIFVRSRVILSMLLLDFLDDSVDDSLGYGITFERRNGAREL